MVMPAKRGTYGVVSVDEWHRQAERHAVRDAVCIGVAFLLGYALLLAVGYFVAFGTASEIEARETDVIAVTDKPQPEQAVEPVVDESGYSEEADEELVWHQEPEYLEEETPIYYDETEQTPVRYDAIEGYSPEFTPEYLKEWGAVVDGGVKYTWYSQKVLPGGGLDIPGRHVDENGYVVDGEGRIAVASSDLPIGTEVDTPFGDAVVYDTGCASGIVDIYTDF